MLTLNLSELILTILNFFVLLFLLKRFLYRPVIAFMDQRNARIQEALERERVASAALQEEVARCEQRRKESYEAAKQRIRDAQAEDERRYSEREQESYEEAMDQRRQANLEELRQNEEEVRQVGEEKERLASALAKTLLGHFTEPPEMLVAQGLQMARERAESTWEPSEDGVAEEEPIKREKKKTADLFAPASELRKLLKEERKTDKEESARDLSRGIRYEQLFLQTDSLGQI